MKKTGFNYFLVILKSLIGLVEMGPEEGEFDKETEETFLKRIIELKRKMFDEWKTMTAEQKEELLQRSQIVETAYERRKDFEELKINKGG